jgi:hypothetical protein
MVTQNIRRLALVAAVVVLAGLSVRAGFVNGVTASVSKDQTALAWPCTVPDSWSGMMGDWNQGMMNNWNVWGGMMGSMGMMAPYAPASAPLSDAVLRQRLTDYASSCSTKVQIEGVIPFANDYYARLVASDGTRIGEVIADRFTGVVYPEPGPAMMWNSRYGIGGTAATGSAKYDESAAKQVATTFLAGYFPGVSVLDGQAFPGYYTFTYGQGTPTGLLSVDAATGNVWVHVWEGQALPSTS